MKKIVVAVDLSDQAEQIIQTAITMAKAFSSILYLVHVEPPIQDISGKYIDKPDLGVVTEYDAEVAQLNDLAQLSRDKDIETHAIFMEGVPRQSVLDSARKIEADLIVMGCYGDASLMDFLLGGMSQAVAKKAEVPILLVPQS